MADITHIMGGAWQPPEEPVLDPPEIQLADAMRAAGIDPPPEQITLDGTIRRFSTNGKARDDAGWYVGWLDGIPCARFGCWRDGIEQSWRCNVGREITAAEEMAHARRMAEAKRIRDEQAAQRQSVAADTVDRIWSEAGAASEDHPYLKRKGIGPHGARITGDGRLLLPMYSDDGDLSSVQYIRPDGQKRYHPRGATSGRYWWVGDMLEAGTIYIAEGFATAASIHDATADPCVIAYSAGNLPSVAQLIRARNPGARLVVVGDRDESGTGEREGRKAASEVGAEFYLPPTMGDANDYAQSGGDLAAMLQPKADDYLIHATDFSAQPDPIRWLIKKWLPREALIMVHGPSGGGKTFLVIDWLMRVASGIADWCGNVVRDAPVVYLAGEGHHGLKARIAAWRQTYAPELTDLWVSKAGVDLNTPDGYQRVAQAIRALPVMPSIIAVDTLHRFLHGDENSAQDAKSMLDACAMLMQEFRCSVLLVHHTGNSDEAQHRARGSSSWRGALDAEISVVPAKNEDPIQVIQRKQKDSEAAEPIYLDLETVELRGWIDEDGEQVTSAIPVQADAQPERTKRDSKLDRFRKQLRAAWDYSGWESRDDKPYISRAGMANHMRDCMGMTNEGTIAKYLKPSSDGRIINCLMLGGIISEYEHGWIVTDNEMASAWMLDKHTGTERHSPGTV